MAATSRKGVFHFYSLAVMLTVCGRVCFAAAPEDKPLDDEQDTRFTIYAGIAKAREHAQSLRVLTGYNADPGDCGDVELGPLPEGQYSGKEAWLKLISTACHVIERQDGSFADMSDCTCSFGLPRFSRLAQNQMLVTSSPLPELEQTSPSSVVVVDRKRIRDIGAASVPDLLRYISQTAFHRGPGFRASGAQYAELRGLGAAYTLVLLNGRRAFGTVADLATSAFDLSIIPISSVERLEVSMDANSLVHGMDAIGGIVNVVLKDSTEPTTEVRYGAARGGAVESHASLSGGLASERGRFSVFLDLQRWGELLGSERDRWNNQDFRRFGGQDYRGLDYRTTLATPFNVRSLDGRNLPGLDSPFAAAVLDPITGRFDFVPGQFNTTSLRKYQAIVPESSRVSVAANGSIKLGASTAYVELLGFKRHSELQLMPPLVIGGVLGANHPENPFGSPVLVDAVLAGLPASRGRYETHSTRAVGAFSHPFGEWKLSTFVARSDERVDVNVGRSVNPRILADALSGDDPNRLLSLHSTFQPTLVPSDLIADSPAIRYATGATHVQASMQGPVLALPAGALTLNAGVEYRRESMDFDPTTSPASRDITSGFLHLRVPLLGPLHDIPGVEELALLAGSREDHYSDISSIRKKQYGLLWDINDSIRIHVSTSGSFRPPSLVDLNLPRVVVPTQMFDPKRQEAVPVELLMGGNPYLRPSSGRADTVGISFQPGNGLRLAAEYWRVKVRDHIAVIAASSLLTQEDSALAGRIVRANPSAADAALNRPGRLISLDVTRANVGAAATNGVDLSAETELQIGAGTWTPRLMVTLTNDFDYSEEPTRIVHMEGRVGVASELGTIPSQRAVASLTYEREDWRASVNARLISSYRDRSDLTGQPMGRTVPGGAVWDLNVSRRIVGNFYLTLGAFNLTNREPPFAHAGGSLGFDASQGDLEGRELYGAIRGTF